MVSHFPSVLLPPIALFAMPPKSTLNFYELPAVKKHMPKVEDRQIEFTGMGLQQHILAVGKTGSGKSECLLNYIYETSRPSKGTFQKIILCYKTYEPLYKYLDENLNGDDAGRPAAASSAAPNAHKRFQMVEGVENLPPISSFPDSSEKNKRQTLVIFDDVVNDRDTKSLKKLHPFWTFGRKRGITCFFLSQSFFQTDIFIRKQSSWLLLCGMSGSADLRSILRTFQLPDLDVGTMQRMFQFAKEPYPDDPRAPTWLKVCAFECHPDKRFSKGWLEYIQPSQFMETVPEKPRGKKKAGKVKRVRDEDDSGSSSSDSEGSDADDEDEDWDGHVLTRAEILGRQS
jgi:hypothetical protein